MAHTRGLKVTDIIRSSKSFSLDVDHGRTEIALSPMLRDYASIHKGFLVWYLALLLEMAYSIASDLPSVSVDPFLIFLDFY